MKHILITSLALLLLSGCAGTQKGRTIEGLSTHTGAAQSSYPVASSVVDADKALITKSTASNATQQAAMSTIKSYVMSDAVTFSASDPLSLNTTTGALTLTKGSIFDTQAHLEAWMGWSLPSGGATSLSGITDWPAAISATEIGYLDGVTSNVQTQINGLSASGFAPTVVGTDPVNSSAVGPYLSTASGHMFYVSGANGLWDISTGTHTANVTTPTGFGAGTFTDEVDIAINTAKVSNAYTVAGVNYITPVSVTGDTGFGYKKNAAACTSTAGSVVAGDTIAACVTSSASNSTATTATVDIGGVTDTYSCTTVAGASCSGTYGVDAAGSTGYNFGNVANTIVVGRVPACAGGTISSMALYVTSMTVDTREGIFVIYSDNGGEPGTLLWNSEPTSSGAWTTAQKATFTGVNRTDAGSYVWVGLLKEYGASSISLDNTGGTTRSTTVAGFSVGNLPASWPTATDTASSHLLSASVVY